ncbi:hypothetical protein COLO4_05716 [Corchorus olitorius]|uniref:Uncharacterized protein n=1 Tax=Corchorus olitorius TaxID=93759 RepID=A0A1R3KQ82_9ROSI|nr:hypothetical protein COLO4_05716 [Corchorus olitorius]
MLAVFLAILMVLIMSSAPASAAAVETPQEYFILNLGRKVLQYYDPPQGYDTPSGAGGKPCCPP